MAAVTQQIPSYLSGVSKEPDIEKQPGFVDELINGYPDFQFGMKKRPGTQLLLEIGNHSDYINAYAFLIRIPEAGNFYGIIRDGSQTLEISNLQTGTAMNIVDGNGDAVTTVAYLDGDRDSFETTARQNTVLILNKTVTVAASTDTTSGTWNSSNQVNSAAQLPYPEYDTDGTLVPGTMPATGVIYKVVNISGAEDDYWVTWNGSAWVETVEPGISVGLDGTTMPYLLEYVDSTTFRLTPAPWGARVAGDNVTNPHPSFVGSKINALFRYKERLTFLAGDEIIMSRPLENYNFYRSSALTATDGDPIDLEAASNTTVDLIDGVPTTQGLVVFSANEQFIMTAGANGVLTPATAALRSISKYSVSDINPVELNGSLMFINEVPGYSRVFSMVTQGEDQSPVLTDISKIVTTWIPSGIDRIAVDNNNGFIALNGPDDQCIYFFRIYSEGNELMVKSWFKWKLPGKVQAFAVINDVFYLGVFHADKLKLLAGSINPSDLSFTLTDTNGLTINPTMDMMSYPTSLTYNDTRDKTYFTLTGYTTPDTADPEFQFTAITANNSTSPGTFWRLLYDDQGWYVQGNITSYADNEILVGFTYELNINLPTTFFIAGGGPDYTASLTLARYKFAIGLTGNMSFSVTPKISGVPPSYVSVQEVTQSNYYLADTVAFERERIFDVPLHKKNGDFDFKLTSDSPYPSSLLSMKWEGLYSPRYYQRS